MRLRLEDPLHQPIHRLGDVGARLAAGMASVVVEPRQEGVVAVGIDRIEAVVLTLLQRAHREAEQDRVDEPEQGRVERGAQSGRHASQRPHQRVDVLRAPHDAGKVADRRRQAKHRAHEAKDRDGPDEHLDQRVAAGDPDRIDIRLGRHHVGHVRVAGADFEELQPFANAIHHQAVP